MHTELYSVSKIFTDNLFRIPDYQRGYSWTEKHLKDFWNDIAQLEEGKHHYTGVLTLEQVPPEEYGRWEDDLWIIKSKRFVPYYVVDGQQRLTTTIILLQVILERIRDSDTLNYTTKADITKRFIFDSKDHGISKSFIFGYEKDNPSYEYLKVVVLQGESDSHSTAEDTIYTHNLAAAKAYFAERVKGLKHSDLETLYTRITQHLLFNIYTISNDIDVFVAFETMNNRGKPLSHLELLKNRLIFLSTKFKVEQDERARLRKVINESWKTVYHYLGKNKQRPLNDDLFLQTHFLLYFGPIHKAAKGAAQPIIGFLDDDDFKGYLLDEVFTTRNLLGDGSGRHLTVQNVYDYAQDIKKTVQIYYQLHNAQDSNVAITIAASDIERIMLERLRRVGNWISPVTVAACLMEFKDTKQRTAIFEAFERYLFLATFRIYRLDIEFLVDLAIRIRTKDLDTTRTLEIIEQHTNDLIKDTKFDTQLRDWTRHEGYYAWHGVKYFMFEYEQHLRNQSKTKRDKLDWDTFAKEHFDDDYSTVEHVYPQKATDTAWRTSFEKFTPSQKNALRHSIGNLIPLSRPKNSSLRNKNFEEKKGDEANKVGYRYGCYSENEIATLREWTAKEILDRGIRLLMFMEKRWGIQIPNKPKALGLDFLTRAQEK